MSSLIADRTKNVKPSATLAIAARAAELKADGVDIVSLSTGEPDFDTPQNIKDAAVRAIHDGKTKYTPVDGTPDLKKAIIEKFKRENQLNYEMNEVIASTGAKQSIYNLCQAILNPHDEVIIPAPYWVSYPEMTVLAGAKNIIIDTDIHDDFKITAEQLEKAITEKTKLLFLNSPSNPSGAAYSSAELKALADVLLRAPQVMIITDDIYEHIYWGKEPFQNIANVCPELKDRTIVVNGVSKAYAMTGWRIGFAAGPAEIIGVMKKIQSQSTSNTCSIAQAAAVEALNGTQTSVEKMCLAFKERHDFVLEAMNQIDGLQMRPCEGTFYSYFNANEVIKKLNLPSDIEFAEFLLNEAQLALVPGTAFGTPGYLRLSYAASMETLQTAIQRIRSAIHG
jgi:aspartate aminotransferase